MQKSVIAWHRTLVCLVLAWISIASGGSRFGGCILQAAVYGRALSGNGLAQTTHFHPTTTEASYL
jgi:hypothetical protein